MSLWHAHYTGKMNVPMQLQPILPHHMPKRCTFNTSTWAITIRTMCTFTQRLQNNVLLVHSLSGEKRTQAEWHHDTTCTLCSFSTGLTNITNSLHKWYSSSAGTFSQLCHTMGVIKNVWKSLHNKTWKSNIYIWFLWAWCVTWNHNRP